MTAMTNLLARVNQVLEAKFGLPNEKMTVNGKVSHQVFFDTANPRVKVMVQNNKDKRGNAKSIWVTVAVEDEGRPGVFFNLGDRMHFDDKDFPQFVFHKNLGAQLGKTSARTDFMEGDVFGFAQLLTQKL